MPAVTITSSPAVTEPAAPPDPFASPMNAWTVFVMSVTEADTPMPTCVAVTIEPVRLNVTSWPSAKTLTSSPAVTVAWLSIHAFAMLSTS